MPVLLPQYIIDARHALGWTQETLADKAGVTVRTIQRIESGQTVPRAFTLQALATALGVNPADWLEEEKKEPLPETTHAMARVALQKVNLACFSYLFIPFIHFLVPYYLLKKYRVYPEVIRRGRALLLVQVGWVVTLHLLLLLIVAWNFIMVRQSSHLFLHLLYPVYIMYFINAGIILYNHRKITKQYTA